MRLETSPEEGNLSRIADVQVKPVNSEHGGLQLFADVFSDSCSLVSGETWSAEEIFGSIPEIKQEFLMCYPSSKPFLIPVEVVRTETTFFERVNPSDLGRFSSPEEAFSQVVDFKANYLAPRLSSQMGSIPLRRKLDSAGLSQTSLFGQKFIQLAHTKGGKQIAPSPIILMFMSLYALGFISRYQPELWNPFVNGDTSGEILLVTKLLNTSRRYIPNLVLDHIYQKRHKFVTSLDEVVDLTALSDINQLRKLIDEQVNRELNKRGIRNEY